MLYPSIDDLMKKIDSKYSLVAIASKRARTLKNRGEVYFENSRSTKYVGIALEEILHGEIGTEHTVDEEQIKR